MRGNCKIITFIYVSVMTIFVPVGLKTIHWDKSIAVMWFVSCTSSATQYKVTYRVMSVKLPSCAKLPPSAQIPINTELPTRT